MVAKMPQLELAFTKQQQSSGGGYKNAAKIATGSDKSGNNHPVVTKAVMRPAVQSSNKAVTAIWATAIKHLI